MDRFTWVRMYGTRCASAELTVPMRTVPSMPAAIWVVSCAASRTLARMALLDLSRAAPAAVSETPRGRR